MQAECSRKEQDMKKKKLNKEETEKAAGGYHTGKDPGSDYAGHSSLHINAVMPDPVAPPVMPMDPLAEMPITNIRIRKRKKKTSAVI